jgi:uncharacterized membrane protein
MATVQCSQCGFVSPIAYELCAQCGLELPRSGFNLPTRDYANPQFTTDLPPPPATPSTPVLLGLSKQIEPNVGIGNVIEVTFSLFAKNAWFITKLVFVIFAPFEIFKALSVNEQNQSLQVAVGSGLLWLVCKALIAPSLIFSMMTVMQTGTTPTLTEAYRWGLGRLPKFSRSVVMMWFLEGIGFLLLIIPGIILSIAFELVYPMASLENRTPTEILKRSYNLTKGHRWNIFGSLFIIGLILGLINIPAGIVTAGLMGAGVQLWPLNAALALVVDIISEITTIASLVIYVSILTSQPSEGAFEN